MNKDEILEKSRKENGHRDLAELEINYNAWNIAGRMGVTICCIISVITTRITSTIPFSPWAICFGIFGTVYFVKYCKLRRVSDLLLALTLSTLSILAFVFYILHLLGVFK